MLGLTVVPVWIPLDLMGRSSLFNRPLWPWAWDGQRYVATIHSHLLMWPLNLETRNNEKRRAP